MVVLVALLATRESAGLSRRQKVRAWLGMVEGHVAGLTGDHDDLARRLELLAARLAAIWRRRDQRGCPAPGCAPCQERGLCTTVDGGCGEDADHDGIDDCLDACPCAPGVPETGGCPPPPPPPCNPCVCPEGQDTCGHDADQDGVDDCADRCPCEPGVPEEGGGPPPPPPPCRVCESCEVVPCGHDGDGDGVDDCLDRCPCRPGSPDAQGCPLGETCATDADCDDGNPCSDDTCKDRHCEHLCLCLGADGFDCGPG